MGNKPLKQSCMKCQFEETQCPVQVKFSYVRIVQQMDTNNVNEKLCGQLFSVTSECVSNSF